MNFSAHIQPHLPTKLALLFLIITPYLTLQASLIPQDSLSATNSSTLTVHGFVDTYYALTFTKPPANTRSYTTQPLYHNEFSINLALISLLYSAERVRGRFALQTGSYVEANYAAEPSFWRNIAEANIGYRITKTLWLDAGIFPSHLGFESAISKDNWNYSRSFVADFSPYYETGAKLTWTPDEQWFISLLALNGWQLIRETNSNKSFGTQVQWKPSSNLMVNWSTYIGNDQPDSAIQQLRFFNNFYTQITISNTLNCALLFDIGMQENQQKTGKNYWWGTALLTRYTLHDRVTLGARVEYYDDSKAMIVPTGTTNNFQTFGISANVDIALASNVLWRVETRFFTSRDAIYPVEKSHNRTSDGFIVTSLALSL